MPLYRRALDLAHLLPLVVLVFLVIAVRQAGAQIGPNRYSNTIHGGIRIAGNTLGLSKGTSTNAPGTQGSIGTFLSTDAGQIDSSPSPGWPPGPPGTTSSWANNSSSAPLRLPAGSSVLYAELVWAGSYQYVEDVSASLGTSVTLAYSDGTSIAVAPDPATGVTLSRMDCAGTFSVRYYARSANVTSFIATKGAGLYTVGGVPGTQHETINNLNAAGWSLIVAYANAGDPTRYVAIRVGAAYIDECTLQECAFNGFSVPASGTVGARLVFAAMEGDANTTGDMIMVQDPGGVFQQISAANNPANNFFASQINDSDGLLETAGTAGSLNHNASTGTNVSGARQGWDVTGVNLNDAAGLLEHGQTSLTFRAQTFGDNYVLVGAGLAIDAVATAGVESAVPAANAVWLAAPSPNPLVAGTRIRYSLERSEELSLRLLDPSGRLVRTLRSGFFPAGPGDCQWDGRDAKGAPVAAGLYLVVLESNGRKLARPLVVLR